MTNIRVHPTELTKAAEELARLSEQIREIGNEVNEVGAAAPSYGGDFGPRVERLGLEALSALTSQSQRVELHADELLDISQAFAEADQRSQSGLGSVWSLLSSWIDKAEEILPSWLMAWLYKNKGYPLVQVGTNKPKGGPPESRHWAFPLLYGAISTAGTPPPGVVTTPTPPEVPPGHTPTPPGWTPTPSPTPGPTGTPTSEEQQQIYEAARAAARSEWQEKFMDRLEGCLDSSDPDSCIVVVASSLYDHHDLDLEAMAVAKQDNLMSQDLAEFLYLSPISINNGNQPENGRFIESLEMTRDHIPNYEPAYLDALKRAHPIEFEKAMLWLNNNEETISAAEKTILEGLLSMGGAGSE